MPARDDALPVPTGPTSPAERVAARARSLVTRARAATGRPSTGA
ncbi:hypothetical protein HNR16_001029 [Pseudoclavibacter chungangensis]|nr:hypothetical protein [Pseudoclavibacter chungangensis]NYJ66241.1 hypothetical protein [Pseudoclavibacter chungangensis]